MQDTKNNTTVATSSPQKHYLIAFFFSFMWGIFGVDRFYLGKTFSGILKLVTFGGVGVWFVSDLIVILSGKMQDQQGRDLLGYDEFRDTTHKIVLWFSVIAVIVFILYLIMIFVVVSIFVSQLGGGSLSDVYNEGLTLDFNAVIEELIGETPNE